MTDQQLKEIRMELVTEMAHLKQVPVEDSVGLQFCADENEFASRVSEMNLSLGMRARQHHRLQDIEEALKRIDLGSFGICDECGDDIAHPRLQANPVTRLCIHCQEALEQEQYSRAG